MRAMQCIKIFILFGFVIMLAALIASGDVAGYVHPRFVPGLVLSCILLFLIGLLQCEQLLKGYSGVKPGPGKWIACALVALPLLFNLLSSPASMGSYMMDKKETDPAAAQAAIPGEAASPEDNRDDGWNPVISDVNYLAAMIVLYQDPANYVGRDIEFTAFVYHQEDLPPNCFLALRFVITCCAADAQPAGLMCQFQQAVGLEDDQWVRIKGKIQSQMYQENLIPVVNVTEIQVVDPPAHPYVY